MRYQDDLEDEIPDKGHKSHVQDRIDDQRKVGEIGAVYLFAPYPGDRPAHQASRSASEVWQAEQVAEYPVTIEAKEGVDIVKTNNHVEQDEFFGEMKDCWVSG